MDTERKKYSRLSDLPRSIQLFLFSEASGAADIELQKKYILKNEAFEMIGDKIMDAIFNDVSLPQAVADIKTIIVPNPITEDKWLAFLADFLKLEAWPLRELFGDELTNLLAENNISIAGWPSFRVHLKPLTYGGAASEIANTVGFSLMGGQLRERLRDLVMTKVKGIRIDAQVKEVLTRQSDFGGIGLDPVTADKTIAAMNALIGSVRVMPEEEYADWLAEQARSTKSEERNAKSETRSVGTTPEEAEIDAIKSKMAAAPRGPATVLDQAVEAIWGTIVEKPADEYLANRLRHSISSRLRDVRNEVELRQLLERDTKVGGLGMSKEAAAQLGGTIEKGYKTFHDPIREEEKNKLADQMEEQKRKIEERKKRQAEEHAQWYREKILARTQVADAQKQLTDRLKATMTPMDVKEKRVETEKYGELVPAPAAFVSFPDAAASGTPAPVSTVKVSKATAELAALPATQKPRVEDVKAAAPRLMGPVQELAALTLSEFRRLAKEPEKAAEKILEKINTLGQESFERRVEGIHAWQQSGLEQSYMVLIAESFRAGKPMAVLAEEKRAKGEDVPSPSELAAIISLNSKLHF